MSEYREKSVSKIGDHEDGSRHSFELIRKETASSKIIKETHTCRVCDYSIFIFAFPK